MRFHTLQVRSAIQEMPPYARRITGGVKQHHFVERGLGWRRLVAFVIVAAIAVYMISMAVLLGLAQGWLK